MVSPENVTRLANALSQLVKGKHTEGFKLGYHVGHGAGHQEGYAQGYDEGHRQGFDLGWDNCMDELRLRGQLKESQPTTEDSPVDQELTAP